MDSDDFVSRIAAAHGCEPAMVRALITDGLAALNERSYKAGSGAAAVALALTELGGLAAWHMMGLVVDAAERGDPAALVRAYSQLDASASQYDVIAQQWDRELASGAPTS